MYTPRKNPCLRYLVERQGDKGAGTKGVARAPVTTIPDALFSVGLNLEDGWSVELTLDGTGVGAVVSSYRGTRDDIGTW